MKKPDPARAMAPRRPSRPQPSSMAQTFTPDADQQVVHLTVQVPEQTRRRLKAAAATGGTSVRAIVTAAIERELEDRLR